VARDGCKLWTEVRGSAHGEAVLFCHGGPGLWDTFEPVRDAISDRFTTVRWDQRGCGRSENAGEQSFAAAISDLTVVRSLAGQNDVTLIGHSWGALLALRFALENSRAIRRLVYVSGTGIDPAREWRRSYQSRLRLRQRRFRSRIDRLQQMVRTAEQDRELAALLLAAEFPSASDALRSAFSMTGAGLRINFVANKRINDDATRYLESSDLLASCRHLETPTLIIDGACDLRPRSAVDSLHGALPNARRVTIQAAGHIPWMDRPEEFGSALHDFLRDT